MSNVDVDVPANNNSDGLDVRLEFEPFLLPYLHFDARTVDLCTIQRLNSLSLRQKPHFRRIPTLLRLLISLCSRAIEYERPSDLDDCIRCGQELLRMTPPPHPFRQHALSVLGSALVVISEFEELSSNDAQIYVQQGIAYLREGLEGEDLFDEDRVGRATLLGRSLIRAGGDSESSSRSIDESISILQSAKSQSTSYPWMKQDISEPLVEALLKRFEQQHNMQDLDDAISATREGVNNAPLGERRSHQLSQLMDCLDLRFNYLSQLSDIDEYIAIAREELRLAGLNFDHDEQIRNRLHVGYAFMRRHGISEKRPDLEDAITSLRECVPALDDPRYSESFLSGLSLSLLDRYGKYSHDPKDLDESILLGRRAYAQYKGHSSDFSRLQFGLAAALRSRYNNVTKDLTDLEEAVQLYRQAIGDGGSLRGTFGLALAESLLEIDIARKDSQHLEEAMSIFREAATCDQGGIVNQLLVVSEWARSAHLHHHGSALEAYTLAFEILPQIASVDKDVNSRQQNLHTVSGLAGDAASCAISRGCLNLAVEFLSAGRAVFWSQSLDLRTPLHDLKVVSPQLARQLEEISTALHQSSLRDLDQRSFLEPGFQSVKIDKEREDTRNRRLKESWYHTLDCIRSTVEGFEDFMRPKKFRQLQQAASRGPVILLTASRVDDMCHALVITPAGVQHIQLPLITYGLISTIAVFFRGGLSGGETVRSSDVTSLESFLDQYNPGGYRLKLKDRTVKIDSDDSDIFQLMLHVLLGVA